MKKTLFVFIALLSVLISCQVDKSGLPKTSNDALLDGTWYLKTEVIANTYAGNAAEPDIMTDFTKNDYYKFNTDNTVNFSNSGSSAVYTNYYSLVNTQNSQTLTLGSQTSGYNDISYTVNKLSKDSLILFNTAASTLSGINITTNTTLMYARQ